MNKKYLTILKELLFILLGSAVYMFSLIHFNIPNGLAEGGATGIALLFYYAFGIKLSTGIVLVNVPLLILGYKFLDKKTMIYTIYGIFTLTICSSFFEKYHFVIDISGDKFLASLFGGIIGGLGLGIVFLFNGTTGGVDIIAKIFNVHFGVSVGRVIQILDGIILVFSFVISKSFPIILYTLIYILVITKVLDYIIEGGVSGKCFMIISEKIEDIANEVNNNMERGMTFIKGEGTYKRKSINIGYCVVSRTEIQKLKSIVYKIDDRAFVTISEVHDVMGEGFSFKRPKKNFLKSNSKK